MKKLIGIFTVICLTIILAAEIELPRVEEGEVVISHVGYTLSYNETHEQANWVAYELTAEEVAGEVERKDAFRADPEVESGSAALADYRSSGYDRGHLAPAADMKWSAEAMSESFYMSNMSPQKPRFNRGIWKKLETKVRGWATREGAVLIVTAGVLRPRLKTIGVNKVSVPKRFYKVILDNREPELKGIGFILPNKGSAKPLSDYAFTIDKVESVTGIDFFHSLADEIEETVESTLDLSKWDFQ